ALGAALRHELLQGAAGRVDRDALRAVLAADAGPQGLVAIERDDLVGRGADSVNTARDGGGERDEIFGRVGQVAELVGMRVVDGFDGVERVDRGGRNYVDRGKVGHAFADNALGGGVGRRT